MFIVWFNMLVFFLACGGNIYISQSNPSGYISSPNYPGSYPPHADCVWTVTVLYGEAVELKFEDQFDIDPSSKYVNSILPHTYIPLILWSPKGTDFFNVIKFFNYIWWWWTASHESIPSIKVFLLNWIIQLSLTQNAQNGRCVPVKEGNFANRFTEFKFLILFYVLVIMGYGRRHICC